MFLRRKPRGESEPDLANWYFINHLPARAPSRKGAVGPGSHERCNSPHWADSVVHHFLPPSSRQLKLVFSSRKCFGFPQCFMTLSASQEPCSVARFHSCAPPHSCCFPWHLVYRSIFEQILWLWGGNSFFLKGLLWILFFQWKNADFKGEAWHVELGLWLCNDSNFNIFL